MFEFDINWNEHSGACEYVYVFGFVGPSELGTCLTTLKGHRYLCLFCAMAVGKTVKVTVVPCALSPAERGRGVDDLYIYVP